MIARYTRPELGAVWTDEARMAAWRDVEVAAAEALDGPTRGGPARRSARATFTVEAVKEREQVTDHDVGGVRRRARRLRRARRGAGSTSG